MGLKDEMAEFGSATPPLSVRSSKRVAVPAPTGLLNSMAGYSELQAKYQKLLDEKGTASEIDVDLIDPSPYQTWGLDVQKIDALAENLRNNPLSTPVIVRPKQDNRFELIAGHHRLAAFKQLQREKIPAITAEMGDDLASRAVLYDNLLAPEWSDYRKFKGLVERKKFAGLNNKELSEESGISRSQITKLLAFESLPNEALDVLDRFGGAIGCNLAYELSKLEGEVRAHIPEAVRLISEEKLQQSKAVEWILSNTKPAAEKTRIEAVKSIVQVRGQQFASISARDGKVIVALKDKSLMERIRLKIQQVIEEEANSSE